MDIFQIIDEHFESEQVPWLQKLVEQPSHTYARQDVEAAAHIIDQLAEQMGLQIERIPDPGNTFADHRMYATPATGEDERTLLLVGHVDTVFPRSLGFLHFTRDKGPDGTSPGDVIRGPGVLDMKSGLSAIFFAIKAIKIADPDFFSQLKLRVICVSDEEVGSPSSCSIYEQLAAKTLAALVFEAGREGDQIVTQRKGGGMFTLTAHGKAAHAGNDHAEGVNAIHALSLLIPHLEAMTDYARGLTINVGLIEGGTAKNTVPEVAKASLDARFATEKDANQVIEQLQLWAKQPFAGLENVPEKLYQVRFAVEGRVSRMPMEASERTQQLRKAYEVHAAAVGLGIGEAAIQGGGSDANILAALGVPCIDGLGPYGRYFHKTEEWSSLTSLRKRTQALASFLIKNH